MEEEELTEEQKKEMKAIQYSLFERARRSDYEDGTYIWLSYRHVDFRYGYGALISYAKGLDDVVDKMALRMEEIAISEHDIPDNTLDKSIIHVDSPLNNAILLLATYEIDKIKPNYRGENKKCHVYIEDLTNCFQNYIALHHLIPFEQIRDKLLEIVESFPEGQILSASMYKTNELPVFLYCNYKQYKWARKFIESLGLEKSVP